MTAVSYCKLIPRVPGANISEVPNSAEEFAHSAGGPQLELGWGPGRAKRARARPKKKKSKKNFLYDRPAGLSVSTGYVRKKKKGGWGETGGFCNYSESKNIRGG